MTKEWDLAGDGSAFMHGLSWMGAAPPLLQTFEAGDDALLGRSHAQEVRESAEQQRAVDRATQQAAMVDAGRKVWEENQAALERNRRAAQQSPRTPRVGGSTATETAERAPKLTPRVDQRSGRRITPRVTKHTPRVPMSRAVGSSQKRTPRILAGSSRSSKSPPRRKAIRDDVDPCVSDRNRSLNAGGESPSPAETERRSRGNTVAAAVMSPLQGVRVPDALGRKLDRRNRSRSPSRSPAKSPAKVRGKQAVLRAAHGAGHEIDEIGASAATSTESSSRGATLTRGRGASPSRAWRSAASRQLLEAADPDVILREALTSGAQRAFEAELVAIAEHAPALVEGTLSGAVAVPANTTGRPPEPPPTAALLRQRLTTSLGTARFEAAHDRLAHAAEGDGSDDDVLAAGEVQTLLGERYRELLPQLLKLIYIEARTRALAPW